MHEILKVQSDFALEVWVSIVLVLGLNVYSEVVTEKGLRVSR